MAVLIGGIVVIVGTSIMAGAWLGTWGAVGAVAIWVGLILISAGD